MSVKPDKKPKPYSAAAIESFKVAFSTALVALSILESMDPLEDCMVDFQRISLKVMEELQKRDPDREKIDFLLDALRAINEPR